MDRRKHPARGKDSDINKSALTIIELLVASVIGLWVTVIAVVLYIVTQATWQDSACCLEIQRNANMAMEKILRGTRADSDSAAHGLLDAKTFAIDNPGKIRFTSGVDSKERSFYLSGDCLMYDPDTSVSLDEKAAADKIKKLKFEDVTDYEANPNKKIISIELTTSKAVKGVDKTVDLSGRALLRNG